MIEPVLDIQNLTVGYERQPVLVDVSLSIAAGGAVALIGPNGAGKSTLLKAVMGVLKPQAGSIKIKGAEVQKRRSNIAYVQQQDSFDPEFPINALEVVLLGRLNRKGPWRRITKADRVIAREALDQVGLGESAGKRFGLLSGGQRQRVLIARAVAQQADLLLLDEPFNGVDLASQDLIVQQLSVLRSKGAAVLMSTHDLAIAHLACDEACLLNGHQVAHGHVHNVLTPDNLARLYGSSLVNLAATTTFISDESSS